MNIYCVLFMCSTLGAENPSGGSHSKEVIANHSGSQLEEDSTIYPNEYIGQQNNKDSSESSTMASNKFHDLDLTLPEKEYYYNPSTLPEDEMTKDNDANNLLQPRVTLRDILLPPAPFDGAKKFPSFSKEDEA